MLTSVRAKWRNFWRKQLTMTKLVLDNFTVFIARKCFSKDFLRFKWKMCFQQRLHWHQRLQSSHQIQTPQKEAACPQDRTIHHRGGGESCWNGLLCCSWKKKNGNLDSLSSWSSGNSCRCQEESQVGQRGWRGGYSNVINPLLFVFIHDVNLWSEINFFSRLCCLINLLLKAFLASTLFN